MLHQEVKKLGENLGDLSKKSFNFIYSSIWQNFTHKLCVVFFFNWVLSLLIQFILTFPQSDEHLSSLELMSSSSLESKILDIKKQCKIQKRETGAMLCVRQTVHPFKWSI